MRPSRLAIVLGLSLLSTSPSFAQFADPMVALAGAGGTMRCGSFVHLSAARREGIVRRLNAAAPPKTLAPLTVVPPDVRTNGRIVARPSRGRTANAPLTAGQLVAACQAASSRTTLRSAYARFDSSRTPQSGNF